MAFEKKTSKVKSGRTAEQQAARDARKAAKKAAAAVIEEAAPTDPETAVEVEVEAEAEAESSTAAAAESRKRKHNEDVEELEVDLEAPTPMNKKEARLAKKKAKREDVEPEPAAAAPKQAVVERRNSVWIGNLSFRTTQERLKDFMEEGVKELGGESEGECVTRVHLPKEAGKGSFANNKGFAYVDFATPELQKLAVGLSEKLLEGRKVLIKLGNDYAPKADARTPKPNKPKGLEKQPHAESSTLFVGNLPWEATEEALRDMIEGSASASTQPKAKAEEEAVVKAEGEEVPAAGPSRGGKNSGLRKVRLGAFEDTGRCKGFAFLDFKSPAEATAALTNRGNRFFLNRKLILQYASESATNRSGGKGRQGDKSDRPPRKPVVAVDGDTEEAPTATATATASERPPRENKDSRGKKWEAAGRKAPGAALAAAKREKVGIVEGSGSKIVFD